MKKLVHVFIFCLFFKMLSAQAAAHEPILEFANDIQRHYCSADWICKTFERMDSTNFLLAWNQVAELLANPNTRWFYAHDTPKQYEQARASVYSTLSRYKRESCDYYWIKECRKYHTFLTTHMMDVTHNCIVEKKDCPPADNSEHHNFITLQDFIAQFDQQALLNFYQFFFEQQINIIINELNYMYENKEVDTQDTYSLLANAHFLEIIYHVCCHKVKPTAEQARVLAYHYERTQSVMQSIVIRILQMTDENACNSNMHLI